VVPVVYWLEKTRGRKTCQGTQAATETSKTYNLLNEGVGLEVRSEAIRGGGEGGNLYQEKMVPGARSISKSQEDRQRNADTTDPGSPGLRGVGAQGRHGRARGGKRGEEIPVLLATFRTRKLVKAP